MQFDREICLLRSNLEAYYERMKAELDTRRTTLVGRIVEEYVPRWKENPPASFSKYQTAPTEDNIRKELRSVTERFVGQAVTVEPPKVSTIYKEISPDSVQDRDRFLNPLRKAMESRKVPQATIESLFATFDAAPSATSD